MSVVGDRSASRNKAVCDIMFNVSKHQVIIPMGIKPYPEKHETTAADILAAYFKADVRFIERNNYKTADLLINGIRWELKSPTGKGKRNIQRQLREGSKQSRNIVFDARRSKIHMLKIRSELDYQFKLSRNISRLILITKTGEVLDLVK